MYSLALLLFSGGCVERKILISSSPPGAEVFLDGKPLGLTPVEIPFVHYGEHRVALRMKSHEIFQKHIQIRPPLYEIFPLDFVSEVLIPYNFKDLHSFHFQLKKREPYSLTEKEIEEVWQRAEGFKLKLNTK